MDPDTNNVETPICSTIYSVAVIGPSTVKDPEIFTELVIIKLFSSGFIPKFPYV